MLGCELVCAETAKFSYHVWWVLRTPRRFCIGATLLMVSVPTVWALEVYFKLGRSEGGYPLVSVATATTAAFVRVKQLCTVCITLRARRVFNSRRGNVLSSHPERHPKSILAMPYYVRYYPPAAGCCSSYCLAATAVDKYDSRNALCIKQLETLRHELLPCRVCACALAYIS